MRQMLACLVALVIASTSSIIVSGRQAGPEVPALVADLVTTYSIAGGKTVTTKGRFARSDKGVRMREESPLGAMIADTEAGTLTLVNHQRREALVFAMPAKREEPLPQALASVARDAGRAVHDGVDVRRLVVEEPSGRSHELLMSDELGIVVFSKITTPHVTTTKSLVNIERRIPEASLFEVPAGFSVRAERLPEAATGLVPGPDREGKPASRE